MSNNDFSFLRKMIADWRDNGWLVPPAVTIRDRFEIWAQKEIKPLLELLAGTLTSEGLYTELLEGDEIPGMGIFIHSYNVMLYFWPSANPEALNFSAKGGVDPHDELKKELPYRTLLNGELRTILEEAILRCLAPRRATSYRSGMS